MGTSAHSSHCHSRLSEHSLSGSATSSLVPLKQSAWRCRQRRRSTHASYFHSVDKSLPSTGLQCGRSQLNLSPLRHVGQFLTSSPASWGMNGPRGCLASFQSPGSRANSGNPRLTFHLGWGPWLGEEGHRIHPSREEPLPASLARPSCPWISGSLSAEQRGLSQVRMAQSAS